MFPVKNRYDEIFEVEMDGWCYGIANYPGEIYPGLVHRIIREIVPAFQAAVINHYAFDVTELATKLSKSAKFLISEKEIAFSILSHLPNPTLLDDDEKLVLAQIVDKAERKYGGALRRLQRRWHLENNMRQAA